MGRAVAVMVTQSGSREVLEVGWPGKTRDVDANVKTHDRVVVVVPCVCVCRCVST